MTSGPIIIIGGGIAGIAAGHALTQRGRDWLLLEKAPTLGGVIASRREGPYLLELGPFSFLPKATKLPQLARDLGLTDQLIEADPAIARNRYVLKGNTLHRVPMSPQDFIRSTLFSWPEKLRFLLEPWARAAHDPDETIAGFVRRRAGRGFLNNLIQPFVSGVVAGDVDRLSVASLFPRFIELEREYGSLLKAFRHQSSGAAKSTLFSFRDGMQALPAAFSQKYAAQIRCGVEVIGLQREPNGFTVAWRDQGNTHYQASPAVVLATPAAAAATLLSPLSAPLAEHLRAIPYAPLVMVHTVFTRAQLARPLEGFGFLATRGSLPPILGSIWASSIFPSRAPADEVLVTWFLGGMIYPEAIDLSDGQILAHVSHCAQTILGIADAPHRHWIIRYPQAIPQYHIGHAQRIATITQTAAQLGPLHLAGNYLHGVSVDDVALHATRVADIF